MAMAVLKLNASFIPIDTCSAMDGVIALFKENSYSLVDSGRYMRSPSTRFPVPSILVMPSLNFVPDKAVVFSSLNVIYRDDLHCQYCGKRFSVNDLEIDHVIPRSRFRKIAWEKGLRYTVTSWENCVSSCTPCNREKADKLVSEAGLTLLKKPTKPEFRPNITISKAEAEKKGWMEYLWPFRKKYVRFID